MGGGRSLSSSRLVDAGMASSCLRYDHKDSKRREMGFCLPPKLNGECLFRMPHRIQPTDHCTRCDHLRDVEDKSVETLRGAEFKATAQCRAASMRPN